MKAMTEQEKKVKEALETFGYSNVQRGFIGWSFDYPDWMLEADRKRQLFVKIECWHNKLSVSTIGSHWTIEDAIKMQQQLSFAVKVLTVVSGVAPEFVSMDDK